MSNKAVSVYAEAMKRRQEEEKQQASEKPTSKVAQKPTQTRDTSRSTLRNTPRKNSRRKSRDLPTRDEIQEFSFRLRDKLKVKVQAEVPHKWRKELDDIVRELNVKKLELYRFIIGEFLGKVRRKNAT
jgi:hypothetical protein